MIDNVTFQTFSHAGITIEGYSRAMVQTVWRVPSWNMGFDLGAIPWSFLETSNWFVSHPHLDHLAALPVLASRRTILEFPTPTIVYLGEECVDDAADLLKIWERLDCGPFNCTLKGIAAGDEVAIGRDLVVKAYTMQHRIPALGFIVSEVKQKLKTEFQGLSTDEVRDLKKKGIEVTHPVRTPLLAYTGDTRPEGLDANPEFYAARILIAEMSFVRMNHPRERIHSYGHMHVADFVDRADRFQNECIIASHVSSRYEMDEARQAVAEHLPAGLRERVHVWG